MSLYCSNQVLLLKMKRDTSSNIQYWARRYFVLLWRTQRFLAIYDITTSDTMEEGIQDAVFRIRKRAGLPPLPGFDAVQH